MENLTGISAPARPLPCVVHLEVGGQDFYLDLLFYHLKLRCYVVIELKACDFEPGFISQLNMYQNIVNDILCHPDDKPTIGLLLVMIRHIRIKRWQCHREIVDCFSSTFH